MKKNMKGRILGILVAGFMTPPLLWFFIIWYTNLFSTEMIGRILTNPLLPLFIIGFVSALVLFTQKHLKRIEKLYSEKKYSCAQKEIFNVITIFIVGIIIYCIIGPNSGLLGLGIETHKYVVSCLYGIPLILVFSVPFFLIFVNMIEFWTADIPLDANARKFSLQTKIYLGTIVSGIGTVMIMVITVYSLIAFNVNELLTRVLLNGVISKALVIGVISIASIIVPIVMVVKRTSYQIGALNHLAASIANGDLTTQVTVLQRDEIGVLGVSLVNMNNKLR